MTTRPVDVPDTDSQRPAPGQILVMFAIFLVAMIGMLGLAVDLGFAFAERRTMQNAADAGALAGARVVARSLPSLPLSAQADVEAVVNANAMNLGAVTSISCNYVNDSGGDLGTCESIVPLGATGVRVVVTENHPTFFIKVVPGAPESVDTGARAMAHVRRLVSASDGPFLPCAINAKLAGTGPVQTMDILIKQDGAWIINPAAIGKTFKVHGPQVEKCGAKASRFKGLADSDANRTKDAPDWFNYKEGDAAGLISEDVEGPDGCKAGQEINNCVVFLPIIINDPPETENNRERWAVAFAAFYITAPKSNEHYGTLLADYMVYGRGQTGEFGWYQGYTGPIVVRLTG